MHDRMYLRTYIRSRGGSSIRLRIELESGMKLQSILALQKN
jgi:hypothetical protein